MYSLSLSLSLTDALVNRRWQIEEIIGLVRSRIAFLSGKFTSNQASPAMSEGGGEREEGEGGRVVLTGCVGVAVMMKHRAYLLLLPGSKKLLRNV